MIKELNIKNIGGIPIVIAISDSCVEFSSIIDLQLETLSFYYHIDEEPLYMRWIDCPPMKNIY